MNTASKVESMFDFVGSVFTWGRDFVVTGIATFSLVVAAAGPSATAAEGAVVLQRPRSSARRENGATVVPTTVRESPYQNASTIVAEATPALLESASRPAENLSWRELALSLFPESRSMNEAERSAYRRMKKRLFRPA